MIRGGKCDESKIILRMGTINSIKNITFSLQFNSKNSKSGLVIEEKVFFFFTETSISLEFSEKALYPNKGFQGNRSYQS